MKAGLQEGDVGSIPTPSSCRRGPVVCTHPGDTLTTAGWTRHGLAAIGLTGGAISDAVRVGPARLVDSRAVRAHIPPSPRNRDQLPVLLPSCP